MAKPGDNTLGRLTEVLFAQLERLESVDTSDDGAMRAEMERSKAVQGIAREINASARTMLDTAELRAEWAGSRMARVPKALEG